MLFLLIAYFTPVSGCKDTIFIALIAKLNEKKYKKAIMETQYIVIICRL